MNFEPHCKSCEGVIKKHCQFRLSCTDEKPFEFEDLSEDRYRTQGNCCHKCSYEAEIAVKHPREENESFIDSIVEKLTKKMAGLYGKPVNSQEMKQLEGVTKVKDPGWYNRIPKENGVFNNRTIKTIEEQGI